MELKDWFIEKDYGIGLAILSDNCKNRSLLTNLGRKPNPDKLQYELRKLVILKGLDIEEKVLVIPVQNLADNSTSSHSDQVIGQMNAEVETSPGAMNESWPQALKDLWNENRDNYKLIRSLHEKLKLMENASDEDRAPLVKDISDMADKIRTNWDIIDAWIPGQEEDNKTDASIDHKRINANRKFISTNLKALLELTDPQKRVEIKAKIQQRYSELKTAGEVLDPDTIDKLGLQGIQC